MVEQRGFTLLEMMVVMVLLGLVTTLALPAMQRWHDAVQNKAQVAQIIDSLRAAGFSAGASRREIIVDSHSFRSLRPPAAANTGSAQDLKETNRPGDAAAGDSRGRVAPDKGYDSLALELPTGWRAEQVDEIRFLANGLCKPGALQLRTARGAVVRVEVRGPICGVELAQAAGGNSQ